MTVKSCQCLFWSYDFSPCVFQLANSETSTGWDHNAPEGTIPSACPPAGCGVTPSWPPPACAGTWWERVWHSRLGNELIMPRELGTQLAGSVRSKSHISFEARFLCWIHLGSERDNFPTVLRDQGQAVKGKSEVGWYPNVPLEYLMFYK